jgi:aminoglycoside phosphotransferase (APT) family kinase protein
VSKIVGDLSPKHALLDGPWLAFDLEKYGLGDPAKDLSTILRFYLYRHDPGNAGRVLKYVRERYHDPSLIYRMYLAALGSGSRLLSGTSSETVRARYQAVLDFYPGAHRYFS